MESPCRVMDEVVTSQKVSLRGGIEVSYPYRSLENLTSVPFSSARLDA